MLLKMFLCVLNLLVSTALSRKPGNFRHAHQKYTRKVPTGLRYNHFLQLRNVDNVLYVGDLDVGGQVMPVLYDTGSSEIVVESKDCVRCNKSASPMYDKQESQTFIRIAGDVAEHVFGSGPALCQHGLESIRLGDERSPVTADSVPFWQVLDHNISFWDTHHEFSGIAGLGPLAHTPKLGQSMRDSEDITLLEAFDVNSFAICLERAATKSPGWLITGPYVDAVAEKKGFMHMPVVGQFHWAVELTNLQVGGTRAASPALDPCNPSCIAIVDSGTSFIGAPSTVLKQLMPLFDLIRKDCSNLNELPDITFNLGGNPLSLPPTAYVIKRRDRTEVRKEQSAGAQTPIQTPKSTSSTGFNTWGELWNFAHTQMQNEDVCMPAFFQMDVDSDHDGPTWILGMPFLRHYYTVFQRQPRTLHIARATTTCSPILKQTLVKPKDSAVTITTFTGLNPESQFGSLQGPVMSVDCTSLRIAPWALNSTGEPHRIQL